MHSIAILHAISYTFTIMSDDLDTLHIPLKRSARKRLDEKAKRLGFDSAQAYILVLAVAAADGRAINFGEDDWGEPTPEAAARLNQLAEEAIRDSKAGKLKSYYSADDMMADLMHAETD